MAERAVDRFGAKGCGEAQVSGCVRRVPTPLLPSFLPSRCDVSCVPCIHPPTVAFLPSRCLLSFPRDGWNATPSPPRLCSRLVYSQDLPTPPLPRSFLFSIVLLLACVFVFFITFSFFLPCPLLSSPSSSSVVPNTPDSPVRDLCPYLQPSPSFAPLSIRACKTCFRAHTKIFVHIILVAK